MLAETPPGQPRYSQPDRYFRLVFFFGAFFTGIFLPLGAAFFAIIISFLCWLCILSNGLTHLAINIFFGLKTFALHRVKYRISESRNPNSHLKVSLLVWYDQQIRAQKLADHVCINLNLCFAEHCCQRDFLREYCRQCFRRLTRPDFLCCHGKVPLLVLNLLS